ncbi:Acetyltransferase, GNAT family [Pseudomonas sp. R4-35-07]|nr:Acetyltransferase, GNAT family [Pseudomonas sp. R4-35-07]
MPALTFRNALPTDAPRALGKQSIHLMCKDQHVPLYTHLGYTYVQPSPSEHGGMAWDETVQTL